jgi:imidazolonepropionase
MLKLLANPSQIVTVNTNGLNFKPGKDLGNIEVLENYSIVIENNIIKDIIKNSSVNPRQYGKVISVKDKVVLPGLIDCHTHTAFAGSRSDEFKMKLQGISYEEIAQNGGGINKTVESVRSLPLSELIEIIKPRIEYYISQGVTTLEIKSGYGLSIEDEIKLLKAVKYVKEYYKIDIISTFLGAHTFPPEFRDRKDDYVNIIINDMLPLISKNQLAEFCDAFCEVTAFSAEQIDRIFIKAEELGFKLRLHSEQFNRIGGFDLALKHRVFSIDHLEVISTMDIKKAADSGITCVLLPGVSFCLRYSYAPARELIDNNAVVALSTDFNPGTSPISNLNLIMSLAAIEMKMTVEETIPAVTINAAKALDVNKITGSIETGKSADFAVFNTKEFQDIVYFIGKNLNCMTIKNGEIIYKDFEAGI